MKRTITLLSLLGVLVLWSTAGFSDQWQDTLHRSVPVTTENALNIEIEYALGKFSLMPGPEDSAFVVDLRYDETLFDPGVDYEIRDGIGYLAVESFHERKDQNFNWDDHDGSRWDVRFNNKLPTEFALEIGMGEGILDLGGAKITGIHVENGLAETELDFSSPNATTLELMKFETGLGKFRAKNLMNARFEELDFECGLGAATLDFHGTGLNRCSADLSVGLGSITVILPADLGVRVDVDKSFMSSVSFDSDFKKHQGDYYTSNWNDAKRRMKIDLEVGLGSASVEILP